MFGGLGGGDDPQIDSGSSLINPRMNGGMGNGGFICSCGMVLDNKQALMDHSIKCQSM